MSTEPDTVDVNGHRVPADIADRFFHADGRGNAYLTDAEYDEGERRVADADALGDDAVTWTPISEYEGDA